jgi:hypothetical protein
MNTTHSTRPAGAPAYFLGRPATVWQIALRHQRRRSDDAGPITSTTRDLRVASQHGAMPVGPSHLAVEGQPGRCLRRLEPSRPAVPGHRRDLR